jgi:hypothetical protein
MFAAARFISHGNLRNYAEAKLFSWAKLAFVGFSSSNFTVQDHIRRTVGDAPNWSNYIFLNFEAFVLKTIMTFQLGRKNQRTFWYN